MFNPYLDTAPVTNVSQLYGRQNLMRDILSGLLWPPKPVNQELIGLTGSGKTSILKSLLSLKELRNQSTVEKFGFGHDQINKALMIYLICSGLDEPRKFWHSLGYELIRASRNLSLGPQIYQQSISSSYEFRNNLIELFDLKNRPFDRIIILFDEFEYVTEELDLEVSRNLRSLFNFFAGSLAFITATRRPLFQCYDQRIQNRQPQISSASASSSRLDNIFTKKVYSGLLEGDGNNSGIQEFIQEPAMENGISFSEHDVSFALKQGGRHPSLTRMVCSHLFEVRTLHPQGDLDYAKLEQEIKRDIRSYYQILDDELSEEQKVIIKQIATGHTLNENKEQELQILEDLGLIIEVGKEKILFTPLMKFYSVWPDNASSEKFSENWNISLYPEGMTVVIRDRPIKLSPKEWQLFSFLFQHKGQVCTHDEIRKAISNGDGIITQSNLIVIVRRLRDKIEDNPSSPRLIQTVRGEGFILELYGNVITPT